MSRKSKERQRKRRCYAILLICAVLLVCGLFFTEKIIKPTISSIGEIKAKSMMVQTVNEAVRDKYDDENGFRDLLVIKTDETGRITLVQADSAAMNKLSYDLAWDIQQRLRDIEEERIQIPIGSILGNQILSQTGPKVKLKIMPLGTVKTTFKTEFTEAGINQTKYKVYLEVINMAKVVVPFSDKQLQLKTTLLVAEAIILGEIPESFIYVPSDEVLDAINP
ncbi:MAG TPA: sporulation protein YunB [Bacillota bacterium]|jgi:sporulation protein YunB|nr:sporulation protein YunB [Bacillota bacterium]